MMGLPFRTKLFDHVIELGRARHPITHMRLHKYDYYSHFVWGKLSLIYGQPHLEPVTVCTECSGASQIVNGRDGLSHCPDCRATEGTTEEITMEEFEARNG